MTLEDQIKFIAKGVIQTELGAIKNTLQILSQDYDDLAGLIKTLGAAQDALKDNIHRIATVAGTDNVNVTAQDQRLSAVEDKLEGVNLAIDNLEAKLTTSFNMDYSRDQRLATIETNLKFMDRALMSSRQDYDGHFEVIEEDLTKHCERLGSLEASLNAMNASAHAERLARLEHELEQLKHGHCQCQTGNGFHSEQAPPAPATPQLVVPPEIAGCVAEYLYRHNLCPCSTCRVIEWVKSVSDNTLETQPTS